MNCVKVRKLIVKNSVNFPGMYRLTTKTLFKKNYYRSIFSCPIKCSQKSKEIDVDPYDVLGIQRNSNVDEIRLAHSRLLKKYHHVISGGPESKEKYAMIQNSYREIIEQMHEDGTLIRTDDPSSLMPYDYTIKVGEVEDAKELTFWERQFKNLLLAVVVSILLYFVALGGDSLNEKLENERNTEKQITKEMQYEMNKLNQRLQEQDKLKANARKYLSKL